MEPMCTECPVCGQQVPQERIEIHVNRCIEGALDDPIVVEPLPIDDENERLFQQFLAQEEAEREKARMNQAELACGLCATVGFSKMFFFDPCGHQFCRTCVVTTTMQLVDQKKCSLVKCQAAGCNSTLLPADLKTLLTKEQYDQYLNNSFGELIESSERFVSCPFQGCSAIIEVQNNEVDDSLSEAEKHKNQYRFRCRQCDNEFCASCQRIPYHSGFTCKNFDVYQTSLQCRFCRVQLTEKNKAPVLPKENSPGLIEICNQADCLEKKKLACQHTNKFI